MRTLRLCNILVLVALTPVSASRAHELQGSFTTSGQKKELARQVIPVDSSVAVRGGRVFVLWLAEDGALAFFLKTPHEPSKFEITQRDDRCRVWIVEAATPLKLPRGFEHLASDEKSEQAYAEELIGNIKVEWKTDLDYVIALDVKGVRGKFSLNGYLFGNRRNKPPKT